MRRLSETQLYTSSLTPYCTSCCSGGRDNNPIYKFSCHLWKVRLKLLQLSQSLHQKNHKLHLLQDMMHEYTSSILWELLTPSVSWTYQFWKKVDNCKSDKSSFTIQPNSRSSSSARNSMPNFNNFIFQKNYGRLTLQPPPSSFLRQLCWLTFYTSITILRYKFSTFAWILHLSAYLQPMAKISSVMENFQWHWYFKNMMFI